jgi:plastocyanin
MTAHLTRTPALLAATAAAIGLLVSGCGGEGSYRAPASGAQGTTRATPVAQRTPAQPNGVVAPVDYPGVEHQHYRFGPITIRPGQNPIVFEANTQKPSVPGYITRFAPDLVYANGKRPAVDVLHLHHGVWMMRGYPTFAVGEEKTITQFPRGFGYRYDPADPWILNHMLHNLTPAAAKVYVTWDIDFVPASAPAAADIKEVEPLWMDAGEGNYPVFDAQRGWGHGGRYTFPDDARGAERRKIGGGQRVTMPDNVTLVAAGGHVHPGGLYVDLKTTRGAQTKTIFRSEAKYFEPAGAVSWDAAMTFTKPGWRVAVRKGDTLSVSATYDTSRASWYEVMGIIDPLWYTTTPIAGAPDPFTQSIDTRGVITHGHLPENDNHGGTGPATLVDARKLRPGAAVASLDIRSFVYALGDLTTNGSKQRPPTVRQGGTLTFRNLDSPRGANAGQAIYHTITACKSPCNKATGIAYPLANSPHPFDSGELGFGPRQATAAANRIAWKTPRTLAPGTYNYFCRVHPFMRGAFRVTRR